MHAHELSEVAGRIGAVRVRGRARGPIAAVRYDSRQVGPGDLFVARRGSRDDGHRFIDDAVGRGARAVVHERELARYDPAVAYLQVADARAALAAAGAWAAGDPARRLLLIGVTGTDGKSSTAWFTRLLLDRLGVPAGLVSSVYVDDGSGVTETPWRLSTPEAPELHALLAAMAAGGRRAAVVEATSIALAAGRLHGLPLAAAAITNVTHEHLEFHGDWERYRDAKAGLLAMLQDRPDGAPGVAVLNREDAAWAHLAARFPHAQCFTTEPWSTTDAAGRAADCVAAVERVDREGLTLTVALHGAHRRCRLRLGDPVQAGNVAAACLLAAGAAGAAPERVLDALPALSPLPGRMQPIANDRGFTVIVDHAHTPAAFEHLFAGLRRRGDGDAAGRVIVVFGSAGEKDRRKRAMQGRVASEHADVVILADEDPRREEPLLILRDIAAGFASGAPAPRLIPDRREAIGAAVGLARPGDTVLLLGKGHEQTIEYADHVRPWDEAGEARRALRARSSVFQESVLQA